MIMIMYDMMNEGSREMFTISIWLCRRAGGGKREEGSGRGTEDGTRVINL
jgi:hypothetical protein